LKYEPDLDFVLIAITAPVKDYRLCFRINKQIRIQFSKCPELCLHPLPGGEESWFSHYSYIGKERDEDYHLLGNKGSSGFLVPEMRTADYFLLVRSFIDEEELGDLISGLNRIPEVVVAAEVDPRKLKSKENLIF
jgi:hypothetical protein